MGVVGKLFALAQYVVVILTRVVAKLVHLGATSVADMSRSLLRIARVDVPDANKQLLETESVDDATQKDLVDDWVSVSEDDAEESALRNLLDDNGKRSYGPSESTTEDELVELSDGEEVSTPIASLHPVKRSNSSTLTTGSNAAPHP
ncbi:unnamed protein product [Phytophthora lilii]|uniref:Unnamed protein product n=1 Tax=Phytophthora lilii TaxID=2077276 RepID=A0A9W6WN47_9STRA|nr:unnamed protein product [Phytophthora lilii]